SVKLLAVAAIFTGVQMMDSTTDLWLMKVMGGFAGWEALFYGLLELQGRLKLSRAGLSCPDFFCTCCPLITLIAIYISRSVF
ncbi:hypothetical protein AMECASPLE_037540, partial [Ameca splendens]